MSAVSVSEWGRWLALPLAVATGFIALSEGGWPREQAFMAGILILAAVLWVSEGVPLFATALIVIAAEVFLLANPGGWPGLGFASGSGTGPSLRAILSVAAEPTLLLFMTGFVLARAAVKEGVDHAMASWLLRPFVKGPETMLYGVMGVTALFSLWMSNTATAAFMMTLIMPLLAQIPPADPLRKAFLLAVPFAASIGGLGTPICSPPNAVAAGYLQRAGQPVSFLGWMMVAIPLLVIMLAFAGWLLLRLHRGTVSQMTFHLPERTLTRRARLVVIIFVLTVTLWVTEGLHGLPASVVALVPLVILVWGRFITRADINTLDWDVLMLIAGGLALGAGLEMTKLDQRIIALLPTGEGSRMGLLAALVIATLGLGTFLSNTAVANLLLPIGIAAAEASPDGSIKTVALAIAFTASLGIALPISTPPNAMAYARGELTVRDMARAGILVGLVGTSLILLGAWLFF